MKAIFSFCMLLAACGSALAQLPAKVDSGNLRVGDRVPNIVGETLDGKPFNLAKDCKGKVVLLDFWATWCGPCKAETPNIKANYEKWNAKGFEVVAFSVDRDPQAVKDYNKKVGIPWYSICDGLVNASPTAKAYSLSSYPTLILLGRDGRVLGPNMRGEVLTRMVEKAMTGTGIAESRGSAAPADDSPAGRDVVRLREAMAGADSLAAENLVKELIAAGRIDSATWADLSYEYGNRIKGIKHPKAIYLMTVPVLDDGSVTKEECLSAGVARAHAGIELGGPYLAAVQLRDMRNQRVKDSPDMLGIEMHLAMAEGNHEVIASSILRRLRGKGIRYDEVDQLVRFLDREGVKREGSDWKLIEYWMESQRGLPEGRASLELTGPQQLLASYKVAGTHLEGVLDLSAMVRVDGSQFFPISMEYRGEGVFTANLELGEDSDLIEIYVADKFGRSDTNEGRFWSFEPQK